MISKEEYNNAREQAAVLLKKSGIPVGDSEWERIEVIDFGLGNIKEEGLQLLTMFETERMAGRILIMTPNQTEPEHWHPPFGDNPGKQEVIRAFWGEVRFYLPGEDTMEAGFLVPGNEHHYTLRREVTLMPGDTLVLQPGSKHWFQAGKEGAVFYSCSTMVKDGADGFTDKNVKR
jgi:D-lyxose ketol-isomerase